MRLAEKCGRPILCLVDTPAADCSVGSEERGISEAIARTMQEMFTLTVPVVVVLTGEGGSGGAIGIGVGDRVLMFEHAIYSVIPPEGCAAILWRDASRGADAAAALQLTAHDALHLGIVDEVLPEPLGGAHRNPQEAATTLRAAVERHLDVLEAMSADQRLNQRYLRFRRLGEFAEMQ
jgi:acetyl-CoA carboxylase carboxyl transferase subunit alpha